MFERIEQIKVHGHRISRALQEVLAGLILFMGALLLVALVLLFPAMLKGVFSGDPAAPKAFVLNVAVIGLCWFQWRYRHVVYPHLRELPSGAGEAHTASVSAKVHGG